MGSGHLFDDAKNWRPGQILILGKGDGGYMWVKGLNKLVIVNSPKNQLAKFQVAKKPTRQISVNSPKGFGQLAIKFIWFFLRNIKKGIDIVYVKW